MEPPLTDLELAIDFIDTLKSPYYEFLLGNATNNFFYLIATRERGEKGLKKGKINKRLSKLAQPRKGSQVGKKKEVEVHNVS